MTPRARHPQFPISILTKKTSSTHPLAFGYQKPTTRAPHADQYYHMKSLYSLVYRRSKPTTCFKLHGQLPCNVSVQYQDGRAWQ